MGSIDRSKKRIQIHLWKKALIHFALCFVVGFFTGIVPTSTASIFYPASGSGGVGSRIIPSPQPLNVKGREDEAGNETGVVNRSLMAKIHPLPTTTTAGGDDVLANLTQPPPRPPVGEDEDDEGIADVDEEDDLAAESTTPKRLLIIVTTTRSNDRFQDAFLQRLAHTLRLVPPPLLWIVVQAHADAPSTAAVLRATGVMYRHLTFKENITDPAAEADHQRNVALSHIEYHRLTGIVHFAGVSNVYDLRFFEEIRAIEVFGAWPVAMVSTNRKRVVVDGPICQSSKVIGWSLRDFSNDTNSASNLMNNAGINMKPAKINISGFAFNSSVLWDPERWGRSTSLPDTSQDSIKFVQEVVLEDETKLKGIPADCSRIMLWHLYIPRVISLPFHQSQRQNQRLE